MFNALEQSMTCIWGGGVKPVSTYRKPHTFSTFVRVENENEINLLSLPRSLKGRTK